MERKNQGRDHSTGKRAKIAPRSVFVFLTKSTDAANQFSTLFACFVVFSSPPPRPVSRSTRLLESSIRPSCRGYRNPCTHDMVGILYTVACIVYRNCIHQSAETAGQTHAQRKRERERERERWYDTEWAKAGCCWMGWEMGRLDNDPSTSRWSVSFSTSVSVQSSSCTVRY